MSRMFQAVGGAMIMSVAAAMISTYIPAEQKGKAMSIIMLFAALGTAIGPTIGGILTQYLSWHWIFFINVPVGICDPPRGKGHPGVAAGAGPRRV